LSVATTETRAAGNWPYRRIVLAVLVVSLVLNLFFVAGAVWTRMQPTPPVRAAEQRYQRMEAELDLNAQQRVGFERYVAAMQARRDKVRQQVLPLLGAAWNQAAKPEADPAQVLRSFDEAFDKRRELEREAIVQTLDLLATLSPEQRGKFVALARERRGPWRGSAPPSR
jgi:uncharacterized membrane protein